jgi:hypothetical protein
MGKNGFRAPEFHFAQSGPLSQAPVITRLPSPRLKLCHGKVEHEANLSIVPPGLIGNLSCFLLAFVNKLPSTAFAFEPLHVSDPARQPVESSIPILHATTAQMTKQPPITGHTTSAASLVGIPSLSHGPVAAVKLINNVRFQRRFRPCLVGIFLCNTAEQSWSSSPTPSVGQRTWGRACTACKHLGVFVA